MMDPSGLLGIRSAAKCSTATSSERSSQSQLGDNGRSSGHNTATAATATNHSVQGESTLRMPPATVSASNRVCPFCHDEPQITGPNMQVDRTFLSNADEEESNLSAHPSTNARECDSQTENIWSSTSQRLPTCDGESINMLGDFRTNNHTTVVQEWLKNSILQELNRAKEEICNSKDSARDSSGEEERLTILQAERQEIDGIKLELDQQKEALRILKGSNEKSSLPDDTYSMMMIPFSGTRVAIFSIFVFMFQVVLFALILVGFSEEGPAFTPLFNPPPDVSPEVRASQFFAIIIALCTQEDTIVSLTIFLSLSSTERWNEFCTQFQGEEASTRGKAVFSCCYWFYGRNSFLRMRTLPHRYASNGLRLLQGLLGLLISMIIIIQSYSVIELFQDFAAMAFISSLDNVAFSLANQGFFGTSLSNSADKVTAAQLPGMTRRARICRETMLFFLYAGMLISWVFVVLKQRNGEWLPQSVTVQFSDREDFALQIYSGVYERTARNPISGGRFIYRETGVHNRIDDRKGHFVYCAESERWTFTTESSWWSTSNCSPNPKAFSPPTDSYDITTVPTAGWSVSNGLALYPLSFFSVFSNDCSDDAQCGLQTTRQLDKRTGTCNKAFSRCSCSDGFYGEKCQFIGPCQELEVIDNSANLEEFPGGFSAVEKATFHGEPVYVNNEDSGDYYFMVFAGRRWVLVKKSQILEHLRDYYRAPEDTSLVSFRNSSSFNADKFYYVMRDTLYSVHFVSELTIGGTPNGLKWYKQLIGDPTNTIGQDLLLKSIDATFKCTSYGFEHCQVGSVSWVGDGICDGSYFNTEQCGWDGGDCAVEGYPDCHVANPFDIGDGTCHGEYNTEQCGWDGGDCVEFNRLYPNCTVENVNWIGSGDCYVSRGYNTEECGYDGGDCCQESCKPGWSANCEGPWEDCVDPKYSQRNSSGST